MGIDYRLGIKIIVFLLTVIGFGVVLGLFTPKYLALFLTLLYYFLGKEILGFEEEIIKNSKGEQL